MAPRGSVEAAVRRELRGYPADIAAGSVAVGMILTAKRIDEGIEEVRDFTQAVRELRLSSAQLRELAPGNVEGDEIDAARKKREERLGKLAP